MSQQNLNQIVRSSCFMASCYPYLRMLDWRMLDILRTQLLVLVGVPAEEERG